MNLFNKYFGKCFSGLSGSKGLSPTLGLSFFLHSNATGNAVTRRLSTSGKSFKTYNKSRHLRYAR